MKIQISILMLLVSMGVCSQTPANITFPYFCSFEDPDENDNWVLNSSNQLDGCNDRWNIGGATFTDGLNSLYISCDNGNTANFGFTPNVVVAYREIVFPKTNKNYTFSFDWKTQATSGSGLYFCLVPKNQGAPVSNPKGSAMGTLRSAAQMMKLSDGTTTQCMNGAPTWQTATLSIPININQPMYAVFVWQNNKTDTIFEALGACIDNFQIVSTTCGTPSDLKTVGTCDTLHLEWYGTSADYLLEYKDNSASTWRKVNILGNGQSLQTYSIIGISEGVYDVRLRGICGTDTSALLTRMGVPVFCADGNCINYVDFDDTTTTFSIGNAGGGGFLKCNPHDHDYGPYEMKSRFTTCWIKNQYDPLTEYKLKTIPDGEMASVRLGNWNVNRESERIEYLYHVDSENPGILILKYAVVLEDPQHSTTEQPYFQLVLLQDNGVVELDAVCGKAQFSADRTMKGWNIATPFGDKSRVVTWKNWTTMGINLEEYKGKTICIRLTTQDCLQGAHYGYAYFTLGCTSGSIESVTCGATEDQKIEAPLGFDYQWFKTYDADGNPVENFSNEQTYTVPLSDTDPYYVRCTYREKNMASRGCHFDLSTIVSPRFPYPDMVLEHTPEDCQNIYRLRNRSHVILDYPDNLVHTDEPVRDVTWHMPDGSIFYDESPRFIADSIGDTITVTLRAKIGQEPYACIEEEEFTVIVPSILTDTVVIDTTICPDDFPFIWEGTSEDQFCPTPGIYLDDRTNYAGCDSVTKLILRSHPVIDTTLVETTRCHGDSLVLDDGRGTRYTLRTSVSRCYILTAASGCDSVIDVRLTVHDPVTFTLSHTDEIDAPASGSITITGIPEGGTYSVNGVRQAPLTGLRGGTYEIIVFDSHDCASEPQTVDIHSECISLDPDFLQPHTACADDDSIALPLTFTAGVPTCYRLLFSNDALAAGFLDTRDTFDLHQVTIRIPDLCRPDRYTVDLVIEDIICGDTTYPLTLDICYPSHIIEQKWNDVLAVTNAAYNGGYTFTAYRWFVDGTPIPDATDSYLYTSSVQTLDTAADYHVELTRADDGITMPTCPIRPILRTPVADYPALVAPSSAPRVRLTTIHTPSTVSVYDLLGRHYLTTTLHPDHPYLTLPSLPALYLVTITPAPTTHPTTTAPNPASHPTSPSGTPAPTPHTIKILISPH